MPNDIFHKLLCTEITKRRPDIAPASLQDTYAPLADLGIDSLMTVDLIMTFAERFGADLVDALEGTDPPQNLTQFISLISHLKQVA